MEKTLLANNDFLRDLFDTIPLMTLLVDNDIRIFFWNSAASPLFDKEYVYQTRTGEVLHCIHSTEVPEGCGRAEACKNCVIRNSVNVAIKGGKVYRKKTMMELSKEFEIIEFPLMVTTAPFKYENETYCILIMEDLRELVEIRSFLPICANCKKIRNDQNYWEKFEKYIQTHLIDIEFSHGMCPDCLKKLYPNHFK